MPRQVAHLLVGDHLGQVKRVSIIDGEVALLEGFATPDSKNPVVSIQQISGHKSKQLIARRNGELFAHDPIQDKTKSCGTASESLNKALSLPENKIVLVYDKQVVIEGQGDIVNQKKGFIKDAKINNDKLALVGLDIPLRIFDIHKRNKIFEADPPEKDWLGIKPEVFVSGLDFVGQSRVATCSKSDSVVRVYDIRHKPKPIILADINQTAFNEHAESCRFVSIASTGQDERSVVVGSNVGQILAIDLRFSVKQQPKKKLQPKTYKVLGSFKGARGASIKDVKVVPAGGNEDGMKVISCCLDRYLRIHNFTRNSRHLDKHVYMKTKPYCCSPVFYEEA